MRIFHLYWFSIRVGDRIYQEYCLNTWLPVFFVLKKQNYVEIVLSAIEKEYKLILYFDLSCLRVNFTFRLKDGTDGNDVKYTEIALDEGTESCNL